MLARFDSSVFQSHSRQFTGGSILCALCAALTSLSLLLLASMSTHPAIRGKATFFTLCEAALPSSGWVVDCAVLVNCVGTAASYLIVASDCFSAALSAPRVPVVLACTALAAPACFFRSIDSLKVTSTVAVGCMLGITLMIALFGFGDTGSDFDPCRERCLARISNPATQPLPLSQKAAVSPPPTLPRVRLNACIHPGAAGNSTLEHGHCGGHVNLGTGSPRLVFCALPLFINAFTCQQNAFLALGALRNPTAGRKTFVCVAGPLLPALLYFTVASTAYLTFGDRIPSNIINSCEILLEPQPRDPRPARRCHSRRGVTAAVADNRTAEGFAPAVSDPKTSLVAAARVVLGVVVMCNYPLQVFPSRISLGSLLEGTLPAGRSLPAEVGATAPKPALPSGLTSLFLISRREISLSAVLIATTGTISLCVTDLGTVVSVCGSSGATLMGLITPATTYLLLGQGGRVSRLLSVLLLLAGISAVPTLLVCR
jgi:amino acid permease